MAISRNLFDVGRYRSVYLWGGPGTVRMNRLKFMDAPVDETVHAEAHTQIGAQRMAQEARCNWAYLMYNWGFPPETEVEDRDDFRRAVEVYQAAGVKVFGYVQASNYVYAGSYRDKDWCAVDPKGRPFYYYTGRYMTCWLRPGWRDHLCKMVRGVVEAGAEGVYVDNPWHGIQPLSLAGVWLGPAGCYCGRCRDAFQEATGLAIPQEIAPETDKASRRYLCWRAEQVTSTLAMLADYARSLRSDVLFGANDFDAVMRSSYLVYGIDLRSLAEVQHMILIEDYGLPRWEVRTDNAEPILVNNALTLRTARALIGDTPLSTLPYDAGIGFDPVYPARRFQQGIAEAAACGATMVVKGTEFVENGTFTLLTAGQFAPEREAIGQMHCWLAKCADLYQNRRNVAPVGLLYPDEGLWQSWHQVAPRYFGIGQALLAAGVPWRVVTAEDDWSGLDVLYCLDRAPVREPIPSGLRIVSVSDLAGWEPPPPSFLARHKIARSAASWVAGRLFQTYFRSRLARRLVDGLGLVHFFWQTPLFRLPPAPTRQALVAELGKRPHPRVTAEAPVLVELWRQGDKLQLHLVNYASEPQPVKVDLGQSISGRAVSPDNPTVEFTHRTLDVLLDVYTVIDYSAESHTTVV